MKPPTKVSATHLAFTGLNTLPLLLSGLLALSLGTLATLVSRNRRRTAMRVRIDTDSRLR